jgi:hypothetical protein
LSNHSNYELLDTGEQNDTVPVNGPKRGERMDAHTNQGTWSMYYQRTPKVVQVNGQHVSAPMSLQKKQGACSLTPFRVLEIQYEDCPEQSLMVLPLWTLFVMIPIPLRAMKLMTSFVHP